jgi:hypothetical protein
VLTPAQLEKYVQRRAEQLNYRAPNARWVDFEPTRL